MTLLFLSTCTPIHPSPPSPNSYLHTKPQVVVHLPVRGHVVAPKPPLPHAPARPRLLLLLQRPSRLLPTRSRRRQGSVPVSLLDGGSGDRRSRNGGKEGGGAVDGVGLEGRLVSTSVVFGEGGVIIGLCNSESWIVHIHALAYPAELNQTKNGPGRGPRACGWGGRSPSTPSCTCPSCPRQRAVCMCVCVIWVGVRPLGQCPDNHHTWCYSYPKPLNTSSPVPASSAARRGPRRWRWRRAASRGACAARRGPLGTPASVSVVVIVIVRCWFGCGCVGGCRQCLQRYVPSWWWSPSRRVASPPALSPHPVCTYTCMDRAKTQVNQSLSRPRTGQTDPKGKNKSAPRPARGRSRPARPPAPPSPRSTAGRAPL